MMKFLLRLLGFTHQEITIFMAIKAGRQVQDYLWGDNNKAWDFEEWKRMLRKRISKLEDINPDNFHKQVEIKKRVLQISAVAINLIVKIEKGLVQGDSKVPSNLPQYDDSRPWVRCIDCKHATNIAKRHNIIRSTCFKGKWKGARGKALADKHCDDFEISDETSELRLKLCIHCKPGPTTNPTFQCLKNIFIGVDLKQANKHCEACALFEFKTETNSK